MIQRIQYSLTLSTGENISLIELDSAHISELKNPIVLTHGYSILQRCTRTSRSNIEAAKKGYDKQLLADLRQPEGGLLRASPSICRMIRDCSMAIPEVCTLRNLRKGKKALPHCWEYEVPSNPSIPESVRRTIIELGTIVGHAWRENSYPVLIDVIFPTDS